MNVIRLATGFLARAAVVTTALYLIQPAAAPWIIAIGTVAILYAGQWPPTKNGVSR